MPSFGCVHADPDLPVFSAFTALLDRLCYYPPLLLSRAFFFFMCDGIDGVEQLPVPPLDLGLILSATLSHRRRVSSMLSVVGRRRFPQFSVQTAGRSPMSMTDWRPAPEYRILCM